MLARSLASGSFSASKELAQAFEFDSASENCLVIPGVLAHDITQFAIEKVKMNWNPERPIRLIYAGITSIIHGVVPSLFNGTAPKQIIDIYHGHLEDHPNPSYKEMIANAKKEVK